MKHFLYIVLRINISGIFLLFTPVGRAQTKAVAGGAQKKDSLFIWAGRIKKDGSFLADNGAIVKFNKKSGDLNLSFATGRDPLQPVVDGLDSTREAEVQLAKAIPGNENSIKIYPVVAEAIQLYEKLKEETKDLVLQDINWGDDRGKSFRALGPEGFKFKLINGECPRLQPIYEDIMAYAERVRQEKAFDLPVPPAADYFHCWACDPQRQDDYDTLVAHYVGDFFKEDAKRIRNILSIFRECLLLGIWHTDFDGGKGINASRADPKMANAIDATFGNTYHPTSCTFLFNAEYDLRRALEAIVLHELARADALWRKYRKDHMRLAPVIAVNLRILRDASMLGFHTASGEFMAGAAEEMFRFYEEWSDKLLKERDFSQIPNIPFMLLTYRQSVLLGHDQSSEQRDMNDLINFNRFKLTIDLRTRVGKGSAFQTLHFHGQGYLLAVFDSTDCVRWVPWGWHDNENSGLPVTLLEAVWQQPDISISYEGTRDFYMRSLLFRMHRCDSGDRDTLIATGFSPAPGKQANWIVNGTRIGFTGMFGDPMQLFRNSLTSGVEAYAGAKTGSLYNSVNQQHAGMQSFMQNAQNRPAPSHDPLQRAKQAYDLYRQGEDVNRGFSNMITQVPFVVTLRNNGTVLLDRQFDAKEMNPPLAEAIVYGDLHIRLEHAPLQNQ